MTSLTSTNRPQSALTEQNITESLLRHKHKAHRLNDLGSIGEGLDRGGGLVFTSH